MYYQCLTPNPFHELLTYVSTEAVPIGCQVRLPYGKKMVYGWVWQQVETVDVPLEKLKHIDSVCSDVVLDTEWMQWLEWASRYYHVPLVQFLMHTLPSFLWSELPNLPDQYLSCYENSNYLDFKVPGGILLQDKQLSCAQLKKKSIEKFFAPEYLPPPFVLSESQKHASASIGDEFQVYLLEGSTGSGKTEVYLDRLCAMARRKPVLLMMPEITLTQSMLHRLTSRLGMPPWVYHSQMSKTTRVLHWLAAAKNLPGLWIGTRSSIFLPARWGMVVMDEEHDGSYAQSQKMYYSSKHMMLMRSKRLNCPIILGSATSSLESLYLSEKGIYRSLYLEKNYFSPMNCHVMDARKESIYSGLLPSVLSAMDRHLHKGHQVLVFLNRRGYAPVLFCTTCSWKSECPHCDSNMVIHLKSQSIRCHHCGHSRRLPSECPQGHATLVEVGLGTQRLEESLQKRYPNIALLRVDQDSTQGERSELEALMMRNEPAIIVGTQMITKGLDAPYVRCVIVVQLDQQLLNTGYRSDEKAYQLLMQVMGRAGRRVRGVDEEPDELWVQTYFPEHALWTHLLSGTLSDYPKLLLSWRQKQCLPPFAYVCQLRLEDKTESNIIKYAKRLKQAFSDEFLARTRQVVLYGPFPAWVTRRKNHYHYLAMVVTERRGDMDLAMQFLADRLSETKLRWSLERDAQDSA